MSWIMLAISNLLFVLLDATIAWLIAGNVGVPALASLTWGNWFGLSIIIVGFIYSGSLLAHMARE